MEVLLRTYTHNETQDHAKITTTAKEIRRSPVAVRHSPAEVLRSAYLMIWYIYLTEILDRIVTACFYPIGKHAVLQAYTAEAVRNL